jgi:hypothetical protein
MGLEAPPGTTIDVEMHAVLGIPCCYWLLLLSRIYFKIVPHLYAVAGLPPSQDEFCSITNNKIRYEVPDLNHSRRLGPTEPMIS